ncbi:MAG: hypothetical protein QNJ42_17210 [Crocosphaera sp.]|nr:hypothetical protein [Crocosphaera sp.]
MSNMIIELLTVAVIVMGVRSQQSQGNTELEAIPVPIDEDIRRG